MRRRRVGTVVGPEDERAIWIARGGIRKGDRLVVVGIGREARYAAPGDAGACARLEIELGEQVQVGDDVYVERPDPVLKLLRPGLRRLDPRQWPAAVYILAFAGLLVAGVGLAQSLGPNLGGPCDRPPGAEGGSCEPVFDPERFSTAVCADDEDDEGTESQLFLDAMAVCGLIDRMTDGGGEVAPTFAAAHARAVALRDACADQRLSGDGLPEAAEDACGAVAHVFARPRRAAPSVLAQFERAYPPIPQFIAWSVIVGVLAGAAPFLFALSLGWLQRLRETFGSPRPVANIVVPVVVALGASIPAVFLNPGVGSALITILWVAAVPAGASILDIQALAARNCPNISATVAGIEPIRELRRRLGRSLAMVGALVTGWLVALGAWYQLVDARDMMELARLGGQPSAAAPLQFITLVAGAWLAVLLAAVFVPASSELDALARDVRDGLTARLDWTKDPVESRTIRDAYDAELGLNVSLRSRFETGLVIAAPLLTAILAAWVT